ncbi:lipid-binding protein [Patiriisocius marinistellae]|uniref:Lipid-binding protein n=1 Tax=Patiriisocius marinistellae TaxID=2494560 RepID=A0A5J4G2L1_9FLAO|nr:YceI family protein [Patiriisocius marinistellae]GEQ86855.1 lipid-binding protein [Patiriisocius marinistellae]
MKNQVLNITLIAALALGFTSCKNETKNGETTDAKEVVAAPSSAAMYTVNKQESKIMWEGNKPTGAHTGTIALNDGSLYVNNGVVESGKIIVDMKSINVTDLEAGDGKESLEQHLMGTVEGKEGDFFNVNKFPTANFEITGTKMVDGITHLSGNLTMKEKTNNVTFPVTISEEGNIVRLKSDKFEIDRTLWDIQYGSKKFFDNLGDKFISDMMTLEINVVANK